MDVVRRILQNLCSMVCAVTHAPACDASGAAEDGAAAKPNAPDDDPAALAASTARQVASQEYPVC